MPGVSSPYKSGHGKQWGMLQVPASEPKCLCTYPDPDKGLFMSIHTLASHCPSHRVNPFRPAQPSVHRVISQGSFKWSSTKLLWIQPTGLCNLFLFLCRWFQCWAEYWGQYKWAGCPSVYQTSEDFAPSPAYGLQAPLQECMGVWRTYILYRALQHPHF